MKRILAFVLLFVALAVSQTQPHSAVLNWNASPDTGVSYNVYRAPATKAADGTVSCGTFAKIGSTNLTTYTDLFVTVSTSYCWTVTASLNSVESTQATPVWGTIPLAGVAGLTVVTK